MSGPLPELELIEAVSLVGDWSPLRGARIFLTGGTGFFGKWLVETLGAANRVFNLQLEVVALSRTPDRFLQAMPHLQSASWLRLHQGDITSFDVPSGAFSHLIHGAASSDARDYARDPTTMRRALVEGTRHVMSNMAGQTGLRVLFLSSGAVYGTQPSDLTHIPEDFPLPQDTDDPSQLYAQGKRDAERIILESCTRAGYACPIARCFAFAGPHLPLDQHFAFGNFIRDALAGGPIRIGGDGTPRRSYLYASELAASLCALLLRGASMTYHVGSNQDLSIHDLANAIGRVAGAPVEMANRPLPGVKLARYVPAVSRIPEVFGLHQTVGLDEAIKRMLNWHSGQVIN